MPAAAARLRNCALRTSSTSALGAPSRFASGCRRPPWRTQAPGAASFTARRKASRTCGNSCTCWWPSTKSGARPNSSLKAASCASKFVLDHPRIEPPQQARSQQRRKRQEHAAVERPEMHRQRTERRRQRRVQADGAARARSPRRSCSAATSSRPIAAPTIITDVALRRPRAIRSRMARLTPSASP